MGVFMVSWPEASAEKAAEARSMQFGGRLLSIANSIWRMTASRDEALELADALAADLRRRVEEMHGGEAEPAVDDAARATAS